MRSRWAGPRSGASPPTARPAWPPPWTSSAASCAPPWRWPGKRAGAGPPATRASGSLEPGRREGGGREEGGEGGRGGGQGGGPEGHHLDVVLLEEAHGDVGETPVEIGEPTGHGGIGAELVHHRDGLLRHAVGAVCRDSRQTFRRCQDARVFPAPRPSLRVSASCSRWPARPRCFSPAWCPR